jgi:hypothetical protein
LQVAAVVVLLALIGLVVWQAIDWNGQIDRAARLVPDADPDEVASERFGNIFTSSVVGLAALFLAGWLGGTALGLRRGSNTARILVFVAGGFQLLLFFGQCCFGALMIPFFFALGEPEEWDPELDGPYPPEESRFLQALYPDNGSVLREDIIFGAGAAGGALVVGLTLAAVVLLALPVAQRWFVPSTAEVVGRTVGPPAPATFMLPPGYMICPDPRAHGAPPHAPTAATPAEAPAATPATTPADAPAEAVAAPDPETPRN